MPKNATNQYIAKAMCTCFISIIMKVSSSMDSML